MSAAEYRVVIAHDPTDPHLSYGATVFNLAGDRLQGFWAADRDEVEQRAREYVRLLDKVREPERELWVDGAGRDAVAPPPTSQTLADVAPRLVERLKGGTDGSS